MVDLLERIGETGGVDLLAVTAGGASVSWLELDEIASRAGEALARRGLGRGAAVGIALDGGPDAAALVVAALREGMVPVVLNRSWWPRELRAAVESIELDLNVVAEGCADAIADLGAVLRVGDEGLLAAFEAAPRADRARPARPGRPGRAGRWRPGSDAALALCSAGVWSRPTVHVLGRDQLETYWLAAEPVDAAEHADVVVAAGGFGTAAGVRLLVESLHAGRPLRYASPDRRSVLRALAATVAPAAGGGRSGAAPAETIELWCAAPLANELALTWRRDPSSAPAGRLREINVLYGPLWGRHSTLVRDVIGGSVRPVYVTAESGGPAAVDRPAPGEPAEPRRVGRAVPGIEIRVSGGGTDAGEVLEVTGPAMLRRGAGPPAGPGRDSGFVDDHQRVHVLGAQRDLITTADGPVWPSVVEEALASHRDVADVAVTARPQPGGALLVAVLVPTDRAHPPFLDDLAPALDSLEPYARPRALAIVDRLPVTASGALHRRMLAYDEASR